MIPVSNKTRSITRVGYKHANYWRQENTNNSCRNCAAATAGLTIRSLGVFVHTDVKTRLIAESSREVTIETRRAELLHRRPRRHRHPDHLSRPYRRHRFLCQVAG